ncbi:MAG: hypothetical protein ACJAS6_000721 [Rickettsiales bacterium]|jgi:hypothetical protein
MTIESKRRGLSPSGVTLNINGLDIVPTETPNGGSIGIEFKLFGTPMSGLPENYSIAGSDFDYNVENGSGAIRIITIDGKDAIGNPMETVRLEYDSNNSIIKIAPEQTQSPAETSSPSKTPTVETITPSESPVVSSEAPSESPVVSSKAPSESPVVSSKAPSQEPSTPTPTKKEDDVTQDIFRLFVEEKDGRYEVKLQNSENNTVCEDTITTSEVSALLNKGTEFNSGEFSVNKAGEFNFSDLDCLYDGSVLPHDPEFPEYQPLAISTFYKKDPNINGSATFMVPLPSDETNLYATASVSVPIFAYLAFRAAKTLFGAAPAITERENSHDQDPPARGSNFEELNPNVNTPPLHSAGEGTPPPPPPSTSRQQTPPPPPPPPRNQVRSSRGSSVEEVPEEHLI